MLKINEMLLFSAILKNEIQGKSIPILFLERRSDMLIFERVFQREVQIIFWGSRRVKCSKLMENLLFSAFCPLLLFL
jgi:hypothetical protein